MVAAGVVTPTGLYGQLLLLFLLFDDFLVFDNNFPQLGVLPLVVFQVDCEVVNKVDEVDGSFGID